MFCLKLVQPKPVEYRGTGLLLLVEKCICLLGPNNNADKMVMLREITRN